MNYQCPQCGLPRTGNQAMGLAMPQCICSWQFTPPQTPQPKRKWVDLSDAQIEQVYFDVVQVHRGAPMPWGQVQFGRALLEKFKEVNT